MGVRSGAPRAIERLPAPSLPAMVGPPLTAITQTKEPDMKTATKLFAATCLISLVSLTTGCGPSPDKLCDHMIELTKKDLGEEAAKAMDKAECVKSAERQKEMQGMIKFNEEAKCAMKAESLEDLAACDGKKE